MHFATKLTGLATLATRASSVAASSATPLPRLASRSLHATPAMLGKRYSKYYFTPKIIRRKEEIFRIRRTDAILPEERLTPLTIPTATPLSTQDSDIVSQVVAAMSHPETSQSRLFAIVHLVGKQYKVSEGDLVQVVGSSYLAQPGDQLILEKVLAIGSADFTLLGRPILSRECATVHAVVVEKGLEAPKVRFDFKKRQNYRHMHVVQANSTVLRIGNIDFHKESVLRML